MTRQHADVYLEKIVTWKDTSSPAFTAARLNSQGMGAARASVSRGVGKAGCLTKWGSVRERQTSHELTKKQAHELRKHTYGSLRGERWEGEAKEFGINRHTLLFVKQITTRSFCTAQGDLLSILYWLQWETTWQRTDVCVDMYIHTHTHTHTHIKLNHSVHHKLTHHCKSATLQYKIKLLKMCTLIYTIMKIQTIQISPGMLRRTK